MQIKQLLISAFLLLFMSNFVFSQTLIDGFNRVNSNTVGNNWIEQEGAADNAKIRGNTLTLVGTGTSGYEWAYQDFSAQYETIFSDNGSIMTWAFNMRQSHNNPDGFADGKYAMMFIVGSDGTDKSLANGYGVAVGKDGGSFPIRFVRFDAGFNSDAKITELIAGGDFQTYYTNCKVSFNPSSGEWTLYAEHNPSTFTDPLNVTTLIGSVIDINHTDSALPYLGGYYNHGSGADSAIFDNFYIPGVASPNTQVFFTSSGGSVNESGGTHTIEVDISDPDGAASTTADVVLTGGSATNGSDISTYSTQQVTFPAGSSTTQSVVITITNDSDTEGPEDLVFELQNVSGGNNAQSGVPGNHTINIIDNEIPKLMISEVADPQDDPNAGFVELFNWSGSEIDFGTQTWYLSRQNDGRSSQWFDYQLTGTVVNQDVYTIAVNQTTFTSTYGVAANLESGDVHDGIDGYFLYFNGDHTTGTLIDAFGVIDQVVQMNSGNILMAIFSGKQVFKHPIQLGLILNGMLTFQQRRQT